MADIFSSAASGLRATSQNLRERANNVANATTPDFQRQEVRTQSQEAGGVTTDVVDVGPSQNSEQPGADARLAEDLIGAKKAETSFKANATVLASTDKTFDEALDILT